MRIETLCREQIEQALPMIWDVFCKYEAVNYPASGRDAFWKAIHEPEYLQMLTAYGAFEEEQLVGIVATRNNGSHIALFFRRRGISQKRYRPETDGRMPGKKQQQPYYCELFGICRRDI